MLLEEKLKTLVGKRITAHFSTKVNGNLIEVGKDYTVFDLTNLEDIKEVIVGNGVSFWVSKRSYDKNIDK